MHYPYLLNILFVLPDPLSTILRFHMTWVGKIPWRRESLPTPVFWSGEFHRLYRPWGHKESDLTEQLSLMVQKIYILSDRCFKSCLLYVSYLL